MKKFFFALLLLICFTGCKNSKSDLAGNEKINADDFLKAFPEINLPVIIPDTALRSFGDTIIISKTVFTQFVQDTALEKFTDSSTGNYIIHPAGIIHKKDRDFLLATFSSARKSSTWRICAG